MRYPSRREVLRYVALASGGLALRLPELVAAEQADRATFALVSDTHLGRTGTEDLEYYKRAITEINATGVALTVFCGDLVNSGETKGNQKHYPEWKRLADTLTSPWMAIPGNHDPVEQFKKHIASETDAIVDLPPYRLICFADAKPNPAHDGIVTSEQVKWIDGQIKEAKGKGLRSILISHITHHENKSPNRGWKIEDGREIFGEMLAANAADVPVFFAGHFHFGLHGWQDAVGGASSKTAQIVLPSASWNRDGHLKKHVDLIVEDYRPAYVIADGTRDKITLRFKPIGAEVTTTREINF
jgi:hypothetical protein